MPWSNQSGGGGWKSGGGGPWGQGPSNGSGQTPDLEDILKKSQDKLKQAMPGGGLSGSFLLLLIAVGVAIVGFYGFTVRVQPDELGIVTRFGKYHRQIPPGLNFRLPPPLEQVYLPKVNFTNEVQVGMRGASGGQFSTPSASVNDEALMLTGDGNFVKVQFSVQWFIKDAPAFLFNVYSDNMGEGPVGTIKDVAESAMREVVGKSKLDFVLTEGFENNQDAVRELMQETLDKYGAGVQIKKVFIRRPDAPDQVIDAFNDVEAAKQDRQRLANQAQAYREKVVPEAKGEAAQITEAAEAYKQRVEAEARGQARRFLSVYEEYKKAPEVTRKRIFLETLEKVFGNTDKIIIDSKSGGSGVVPYLPLNELNKKNTPNGGQ